MLKLLMCPDEMSFAQFEHLVPKFFPNLPLTGHDRSITHLKPNVSLLFLEYVSASAVFNSSVAYQSGFPIYEYSPTDLPLIEHARKEVLTYYF